MGNTFKAQKTQPEPYQYCLIGKKTLTVDEILQARQDILDDLEKLQIQATNLHHRHLHHHHHHEKWTKKKDSLKINDERDFLFKEIVKIGEFVKNLEWRV